MSPKLTQLSSTLLVRWETPLGVISGWELMTPNFGRNVRYTLEEIRTSSPNMKPQKK